MGDYSGELDLNELGEIPTNFCVQMIYFGEPTSASDWRRTATAGERPEFFHHACYQFNEQSEVEFVRLGATGNRAGASRFHTPLIRFFRELNRVNANAN